jgi:hypothetical protein
LHGRFVLSSLSAKFTKKRFTLIVFLFRWLEYQFITCHGFKFFSVFSDYLIMSVFQRITDLGVSEENTEEINSRIKITNFLCIFFFLLAVPFTVITFYYFPSIAYIPPGFLVLCGSSVYLNKLGLYRITRAYASFGLITVYIWYATFIMPPREPPFASLYSLLVLFWMPPWMMYSLREWKALLPAVLYTLAGTLLFPYLNSLHQADLLPENVQLFRDGWLAYVAYITAFAAFSGALWFFHHNVRVSERKNKKMLSELETKNAVALKNEHKLNNYLEEINKNLEEDRQRQWASEGLAKFALLLRSQNLDEDVFYARIIGELVKYIGAIQGSLFLLRNENGEQYLELAGAYAYDKRKFLEKRVDTGQGLLGQAVLEKSFIYMTRVPDRYVQITSGLGEANPSNILIVPLQVNEEIFGVVEFAAFDKLEPYQIDFVEKAGESIASALFNLQTNVRMKALLEESMRQQEMMKTQEEEMRQNLKELMATQEEMERKYRE